MAEEQQNQPQPENDSQPQDVNLDNAVDERSGRLSIKQSLKVIFSWSSKERMWYPKTRAWYVISALVILIATFVIIRQNLSIVTYIAFTAMMVFMLLWFLQGYLEPWEVEHKITSKGLFTHNHLVSWEDIAHFWMAEKKGQLLMHVDFPKQSSRTRITILIPDEVEFEVFQGMIEFTKYATPEEAEYTFISRPIYGEYVPVSRYIGDLDQAL